MGQGWRRGRRQVASPGLTQRKQVGQRSGQKRGSLRTSKTPLPRSASYQERGTISSGGCCFFWITCDNAQSVLWSASPSPAVAGFPEWSQPRKSVSSHAYTTWEDSWSDLKTKHPTQQQVPQGGPECFLLRAWRQLPNLPRVHGHSRGLEHAGRRGTRPGSSAGPAGPSLGGARQGPLSLFFTGSFYPFSFACLSLLQNPFQKSKPVWSSKSCPGNQETWF